MDICSAIVFAQKESLDKIMTWLNALPGVEVHEHDERGKIIITIEEDSKDKEAVYITKTMTDIHHHEGVLSVSLVSQYSDV